MKKFFFYLFLILFIFAAFFSAIKSDYVLIPMFEGKFADIRINSIGDESLFYADNHKLTPYKSTNAYLSYEINNRPVHKISFDKIPEKLIITVGHNLFYFTKDEMKKFEKTNNAYLVPDNVKYCENSKFITDKGFLKSFFTFFMSLFYGSFAYVFLILALLFCPYEIKYKNRIACFLLFLYTTLLLADLTPSFWTDELYSVYMAGNPDVPFDSVMMDAGNPPLFFILSKIWLFILNKDPFEARLLPALFSILNAALLYIFVKKNSNQNVALIALFLFIVNLYCIISAQEYRCYSLAMCLNTLLAYLSFEIIKKGENKYFILYSLFLALSLNTHYFCSLFAFSNFFLILFLEKKSKIKFLISNVLAALFFVPYLLITGINKGLIDKNFNQFAFPHVQDILFGLSKISQSLICLIIVLLFTFYFIKTPKIKDMQLYFYSVYIIASLCLVTFLFSFIKPIYADYYLITILPFVLIAFAFVISHPYKNKIAGGIIILIMLSAYFTPTSFITRQRSRLVDFKRLIEFYNKDKTTHAALIVPHSDIMIKRAFNLDDTVEIIVKRDLDIKNLLEIVNSSEKKEFYLKLDYNNLKFFDIIQKSYDAQYIRTDKDVLLLRIRKNDV